MALFDDSEFSSELPLGELFKLPRKFIKGKSTADEASLKAIAKQLKVRGKNISPVMVKVLARDSYEAVFNTHLVEAAKMAKLDFVMCIVVDERMLEQVKLELGIEPIELKPINICLASESEIADAIVLIKSQTQGFTRVNSKKVAKSVVKYRTTKKLQSLKFFTELKCGIGKAKLPVLANFFVVE